MTNKVSRSIFRPQHLSLSPNHCHQSTLVKIDECNEHEKNNDNKHKRIRYHVFQSTSNHRHILSEIRIDSHLTGCFLSVISDYSSHDNDGDNREHQHKKHVRSESGLRFFCIDDILLCLRSLFVISTLISRRSDFVIGFAILLL